MALLLMLRRGSGRLPVRTGPVPLFAAGCAALTCRAGFAAAGLAGDAAAAAAAGLAAAGLAAAGLAAAGLATAADLGGLPKRPRRGPSPMKFKRSRFGLGGKSAGADSSSLY